MSEVASNKDRVSKKNVVCCLMCLIPLGAASISARTEFSVNWKSKCMFLGWEKLWMFSWLITWIALVGSFFVLLHENSDPYFLSRNSSSTRKGMAAAVVK